MESASIAAPGGPRGHAGTDGFSHELLPDDVEVAVSKRRPRSQTSRVADGGSDSVAWRCDADAKLAGLFQAALEEPIPDDMLRLVRMIGTQGAHSD